MSTLDCVVDSKDMLGEVPTWSPVDQCLYWVDVRGPTLHALRPSDGSVRHWPLPEKIGSLALRERGGLVLALKTGLYTFEPGHGEPRFVMDPEPGLPGNRLNDGKCDRQGRFWVGSMNDGDRLPTGSLYRIGPDWACTATATGITVPNSLAWSPDGRTMYFADTPKLRIMAYDFDIDSGMPGNERLFVDLSSRAGRPDGSTVDADGCLWNAEVWASRVVRYTPQGRVDRVVELPVPGVTCCAFGGTDMRTLYITSCRQKMTEAELAAHPLAGGLFAVDVGVAGIAETSFKG